MWDIELESRVENINIHLPPEKQLTVVYPEGYDSDRIRIVKGLDGEPTDDRNEDADIDIVAVNEYKEHTIDAYLTAIEDIFS